MNTVHQELQFGWWAQTSSSGAGYELHCGKCTSTQLHALQPSWHCMSFCLCMLWGGMDVTVKGFTSPPLENRLLSILYWTLFNQLKALRTYTVVWQGALPQKCTVEGLKRRAEDQGLAPRTHRTAHNLNQTQVHDIWCPLLVPTDSRSSHSTLTGMQIGCSNT